MKGTYGISSLLSLAILSVSVSSSLAAGVRVVRAHGLCEFERGAAGWQRITLKSALQEGDHIRTSAGSGLTVVFAEGSQSLLGASTTAILHDDTAPASQSATKGLIELARGSLRMKIQRSRESLRTRATTATAIIGVRGTEFFVIAEAARTVVGVTKGTVAVANVANPGDAIDVNAGAKTIVYAGQPPMPPTPLSSGEGKEGSSNGSALDRIEDAAVEETEQLPTEKFLAFPDLHIDSLRNPAYAAAADHSDSQVFSRVGTASRQVGDTPSGFSIAGATVTGVGESRKQSSNGSEIWASTFHPSASGDVLGGFGTFQRQQASDTDSFLGTALVGGVPTSFTQAGALDSPDLSSRFNAVDVGVVAARPFDRFDAGILLRYHTSGSHGTSTYRQSAPGLPEDSEVSTARGSADLQEGILGVRTTTRGGVELGWSVGRTQAHSDVRDTTHFVDSLATPLERAAETFSGWHTEIRARKRLSDRWAWGAALRMIHLDGDGNFSDAVGLAAESVRDRFLRLGFGFGFTPSPRTAFGFDLVGGARKETAVKTYLPSGNLKEDESESNPSIAFHLGGQHWLTDRTFVFFDTSLLKRRVHKDFLSYADVAGSAPTSAVPDRHIETLTEWMVGCGYRVTTGTWIEYLVVEPLAPGRGLQHNLLMRWRK